MCGSDEWTLYSPLASVTASEDLELERVAPPLLLGTVGKIRVHVSALAAVVASLCELDAYALRNRFSLHCRAESKVRSERGIDTRLTASLASFADQTLPARNAAHLLSVLSLKWRHVTAQLLGREHDAMTCSDRDRTCRQAANWFGMGSCMKRADRPECHKNINVKLEATSSSSCKRGSSN